MFRPPRTSSSHPLKDLSAFSQFLLLCFIHHPFVSALRFFILSINRFISIVWALIALSFTQLNTPFYPGDCSLQKRIIVAKRELRQHHERLHCTAAKLWSALIRAIRSLSLINIDCWWGSCPWTRIQQTEDVFLDRVSNHYHHIRSNHSTRWLLPVWIKTMPRSTSPWSPSPQMGVVYAMKIAAHNFIRTAHQIHKRRKGDS